MQIRVAVIAALLAAGLIDVGAAQQKKYVGADGKLRVALAKQPLSPNGPSKGPTTMAEGGIQKILDRSRRDGSRGRSDADAGRRHRSTAAGSGSGMSLGHFADIVTQNERDGYFTVGLLATCPSMPGLVAGLQRSGADARAAQDRHAVARRASGLQHAGNDSQRIAGRDAGRGRDGPRAAGDAARREARSAAARSSRRDGRCSTDRSARAAPARQLADRAAQRRRSPPT